MALRMMILAALLSLSGASTAWAASGRVIKVLPHYLDQQGRHTLSPSLYDRDAYQAYLRTHPEQRSGMRFNVQWSSIGGKPLKVRVQLRGRKGDASTTTVLESKERKRGLFSNWTALMLQGKAYQDFGEVTAWRVTLWDGDQLVAAKQSFLWEG